MNQNSQFQQGVEKMGILIDKLEFVQKPLKNSLIIWYIGGKRYKKGCFLMNMNKKM